MDEDIRALVEAIHATPTQAVLAVSGAGSLALAWLLGVGGASRTVLEATIPYAQTSFAAYAGREPREFASPEAARLLAEASLARARALAEPQAPLVGLGCAASIATDRTKRGEHRAFISLSHSDGTARSYALHLQKGARARDEEEALVSRLALRALAASCGIDGPALELGLLPSERLEEPA